MAKRRMFNLSIVENDVFLDMPLTSQSLYFHLGMHADDYGFVSPKRVMRMIGASNDDLQILIAKRYVLQFDSGVIVIKHWQINNTVRKDRSTPTTFQHELNQLTYNEYGAYTERRKIILPLKEIQQPKKLNAKKQKNGNQMATQIRLDKINNTMVFLDLLNKYTGRHFRVLPRGAAKTLKQFSLEEIEQALRNATLDTWHSSRLSELSSDYLTRPSTIDTLLNRKPQKKQYA